MSEINSIVESVKLEYTTPKNTGTAVISDIFTFTTVQ